MEMWEAERDGMLDLAERLTVLDDEQWNSPSLCAEWRIRDVLAHVNAGADGAFGLGKVVRGMLRHRLNYTRWVAADGQARGRQEPAVLLQGLRDVATDRNTRSCCRTVRGLMHV